MGRELKGLLQELDMLVEEVNGEGSKKNKSNQKKKGDEKGKEKVKLKKVKEIKNSLNILEKEVFIRVENPTNVVEELKKSKITLKDITQTLVAIAKINKLKEELILTLNKQIYELKESVKNLEKELNIKEHFQGNIGPQESNGVDIDIMDTIESDIEEIRKNIGLAK